MLCDLFQHSLNTWVVSSDWRHAHVKHTFKSDVTSDATSYRPISLNSALRKFMEYVLHTYIIIHLDNTIFPFFANQPGIRKEYSWRSSFEFIDDLYFNSHAGTYNAMFIGFTKAFDTGPRSHLLMELSSLIIYYHVANRISLFLTYRARLVAINDSISQWSVLGPFLFFIYISEITTSIDLVRLFADNNVIYKRTDNSNDGVILQQNLNKTNTGLQVANEN